MLNALLPPCRFVPAPLDADCGSPEALRLTNKMLERAYLPGERGRLGSRWMERAYLPDGKGRCHVSRQALPAGKWDSSLSCATGGEMWLTLPFSLMM